MNTSTVFGIDFERVSLEQLGRKVITGKMKGKVIVTPNVDHVVRFHQDIAFRKEYIKSDIFVNDSRVLRLLSNLGLTKLEYLVPGSDLTSWIFDNISTELSVTVIGTSPSSFEKIRAKYGLSNFHHHNPPMGFIENKDEVEKCVEFCLATKADVIFFAVGSPRQEVLANMVKERGCDAAMLCIGASILFLSGEEKRAPKLMQLLHLEWFYRLLHDPKRMYKRYLIDGFKIIPIYFKDLIK